MKGTTNLGGVVIENVLNAYSDTIQPSSTIRTTATAPTINGKSLKYVAATTNVENVDIKPYFMRSDGTVSYTINVVVTNNNTNAVACRVHLICMYD